MICICGHDGFIRRAKITDDGMNMWFDDWRCEQCGMPISESDLVKGREHEKKRSIEIQEMLNRVVKRRDK